MVEYDAKNKASIEAEEKRQAFLLFFFITLKPRIE